MSDDDIGSADASPWDDCTNGVVEVRRKVSVPLVGLFSLRALLIQRNLALAIFLYCTKL
jgi:hypothetical protein